MTKLGLGFIWFVVIYNIIINNKAWIMDIMSNSCIYIWRKNVVLGYQNAF